MYFYHGWGSLYIHLYVKGKHVVRRKKGKSYSEEEAAEVRRYDSCGTGRKILHTPQRKSQMEGGSYSSGRKTMEANWPSKTKLCMCGCDISARSENKAAFTAPAFFYPKRSSGTLFGTTHFTYSCNNHNESKRPTNPEFLEANQLDFKRTEALAFIQWSDEYFLFAVENMEKTSCLQYWAPQNSAPWVVQNKQSTRCPSKWILGDSEKRGCQCCPLPHHSYRIIGLKPQVFNCPFTQQLHCLDLKRYNWSSLCQPNHLWFRRLDWKSHTRLCSIEQSAATPWSWLHQIFQWGKPLQGVSEVSRAAPWVWPRWKGAPKGQNQRLRWQETPISSAICSTFTGFDLSLQKEGM